MRKLLAIIIIIICVGGYYYYIEREGSVKLAKKERSTELDKIIEHSAQEESFSNPDEVMIRNNRIISYLYGGDVKPEEIEVLISIQRNLFDSELLEINPFELQLEKVKSKIEDYKEKDFKIINIKQKSAEYNEKNQSISTVKVIQYTNSGKDNYLKYYLRKQVDNNWRIIGWEIIDKFTISEELEL